MKKLNIIIIIVLLLVASIKIGNNYFDSKVRSDIRDNVKKYHELLLDAVSNLKKNDTENKELSYNISIFYNKYDIKKTSKKEKELLNEMLDEALNYEYMISAKKQGNTDFFNKSLSNFENASRIIYTYFKKQ